jgi:hypothetical protein
MPLQSSGAISLYDICDFFGAARSTPLESFYRGGSYVPNITANNGIPTSGTINVKDFYGAVALKTYDFIFTAGQSYPYVGYNAGVYGSATTSPTIVTANGTFIIAIWDISTGSETDFTLHNASAYPPNDDNSFQYFHHPASGQNFLRSSMSAAHSASYDTIWSSTARSTSMVNGTSYTLTVHYYG